MKLRIHGNSLRLRVSPSEVRRLLESGRIDETIHFGADESAQLTYALERGPETAEMTVRFRSPEVTVLVPSGDAQRWADGDEVGLYGQVVSSQGPLLLAVEKDFACLDKSDAENEDTFPNPQQGAVC